MSLVQDFHQESIETKFVPAIAKASGIGAFLNLKYELYKDDEVTSKKGIYAYILTGEEKHLSIRTFTESQKAQAYEKCGGVCAKCGKQFKLDEMQADHIMPWSKGGKTELDNCQMLCSHCNAAKSNKY